MDSTRKHLRFNCHGSADLNDGANGRCWGHLGDISLGGFYVSTFGPWPINTEVRFKLEAEGKEICGVGIVATSHPGVGMAVVIQELSADHQERLTQVIDALESTGDGAAGVGLRV
jgi:hypothetical protein